MDKPKIKLLKVFKVEGKQEVSDETKNIHLYREFDANENRVKEISYSHDGEIVEEKFFVYNENGKLIEEKSFYAEDDVTEIRHFEYDEKGRVYKTHKSYGEQGDEDTTVYSYNDAGKLIEKRTEDSDGELEHAETWKYEGENLVENVSKDADGSIIESSKYKYDDAGNITEEIRYTSEKDKEYKILYDHIIKDKTPDTTVYNTEGKIVQRSRHTYDEKQRLIKEVTETVSVGVQKFTTENSYDEQDNVIEIKVVDKNENLISKMLYKFNNHNLPIEEIHLEQVAAGMDLRESKVITEYEFY